VALAGADNELALAAAADLAGDGIVEESMLEPFDDKPFEAVERLAGRDLLCSESRLESCPHQNPPNRKTQEFSPGSSMSRDIHTAAAA
jgi:hypothetical protein